MRKHSSFALIAITATLTLWGCDGGSSDDGAVQPGTGAGTTPTGGGAPGTLPAGTNVTPTGTTPTNPGGTTPVGTTPGAQGGSGAGTKPVVSTTPTTGGAPTTETQPPMAPVECTDKATVSQTIKSAYGGVDIPVTGKSKSYRMSTNWWSKYVDQTVTVNGLGFKVGNPSNVTTPDDGKGIPIGYPTIYIGAYNGTTTQGSNLPKQVSKLTKVDTIFKTNSLAIEHKNFNAAYDVWFTASSTPLSSGQNNPGKGGAYLMVWMYDPAGAQPRGAIAARSQIIPGVSGRWTVWVDKTDPLCISYVATTAIDSLSYDLNNFIKDSVTKGYGIKDSMYLSVVFGGFEIWGGGDGVALQEFCVDVK